MQKKELIAVVIISVVVILASKEIQQLKMPAPIPAEQTSVQIETMPAPKPVHALAHAKRVQLGHDSQEFQDSEEGENNEKAALDFINPPAETTLSKPGMTLKELQPDPRRISLFDLDMMLQSQVIVEPYVVKWSIAAPIFYILPEPGEVSMLEVRDSVRSSFYL
jgi:hypothetical protein